MVSTKKVSKKTSSRSSKNIDAQPTEQWDAVPQDVQKPSRPPAELLNIEPIGLPTEPVVKISPEVQDTEPMQVYDNTASNNILQPRPEKESGILKIIGVAICSIVVLFWLIVLVLSAEIHTGPYDVEKNITTIRNVATTLSFDEMLIAQNGSEVISLQGMLRKEIINTTPQGSEIYSSREETYIVDDTGDKIIARVKPSQKAEYDKYFTTNIKVKTAYNVTGVYRFAITNYILEVDAIKPYSRTLNEVSEWKIENVTVKDNKGIKVNIQKGWTKVSSIINPIIPAQNSTDS